MKASSLLPTLVLAAAVGFPTSGQEGRATELAQAEARWQTHGPKTYRFGITLACECFPKSMSFRVADGQAVAPPNADETSRRIHDSYGTVEKLFAVIRRAVTAGGYRVVVKYDSELGYPIWADLDPRRDVIDDELFFRVTRFRRPEGPVLWMKSP